jgi:molecular chaperone GrpE
MSREHENEGQSPTGTVPADAEEEGLSPQGTDPSSRDNATAVGSPLADPPDDPVAAAEAKAQEHLDDLRRLAAEFDNYRKRVARDQELVAQRASERLLKALLPVVDDLERALEAAEQHEEAKLEEGVRLVHRALAEVLRAQGLEEIDANGRFDPHVHEALLSQPSADHEEGTVIQVAQKGYRLGELVLRPARVVVSAGPAEENGG